MKSILSSAVLAVASLAILTTPAYGQDETDGQPTDPPSQGLTTMRTPKFSGCYSDPGNMVDMGYYTFQAMGWCQPLCIRLSKPFLALTNGSNCLCGDSAPSSGQVNGNECNTPCLGFPGQTCGGSNAFAVYNDGFQQGDPTGSAKITIPSQTGSSDGSSPTSSQTAAVAVSTALVTQSGGQTVPTVIRVTETAAASSSGGSNKVAIAVGVVVAVVAVAAIVGALFFWMRHRKNKAIEEERARHQFATNLATGEKPGSSYSLGDSRLDQSVMFQRRQSDGSIADNEDYSRRILKVTNPDDR